MRLASSGGCVGVSAVGVGFGAVVGGVVGVGVDGAAMVGDS